MVQNAGVGALLRSRREELGQDTESVARQLRIRSIYIRAIEDGRLQDLPGTAYAVGFVRTYADFLGFDGNSVVANYRDELGQRGRPDSVSWQIEDKDGGFPVGRVAVILVVIAAAAYGLWYYLANTQSGSGLIEAVPEYLKKSTGTDKAATPASGQSTSAAAQPSSGATTGGAAGSGSSSMSPAPTETQAAPAGTQDSSVTPSTETPANPPATTTSETAPATTTPAAPAPATEATPAGQISATPGETAPAAQVATGQTTTNPAVPAAPAASPTTPAPAGQPVTAGTSGEATPDVAAAAATGTTRISVRAKLESWVQINDKDGKPVLSRVLRAGETYAVPDEKGLTMNTGNAGGIEIVVDGKSLPTLGSVGLVKRNIVLDADKLASGSVTTKVPGKPDGGTDGTAPAPASD